jgi:hypothetical protein
MVLYNIIMKFILTVIFILLFTAYASGDSSDRRQTNSADKPVTVYEDGRRGENFPDKISEKTAADDKKTEAIEEKPSEKTADDKEDLSATRLKNPNGQEQNYNLYNTYNVTPDMPGYWITRGDSFFSDRRYTEAIECYLSAWKINPSSKDLDEKIEMTKILLDKLEVYFKNSEGTTNLHSKINNFYDVKALVYNGADVNATNIYGDTPLHSLAGYNGYNPDRLDTARFLLEHGASINAQDKEGNTPLHKAAENGLYSLVQFLVNMGATIDEKNFYGYTPLDLAVLWGRQDTALLLMKYGAK